MDNSFVPTLKAFRDNSATFPQHVQRRFRSPCDTSFRQAVTVLPKVRKGIPNDDNTTHQDRSCGSASCLCAVSRPVAVGRGHQDCAYPGFRACRRNRDRAVHQQMHGESRDQTEGAFLWTRNNATKQRYKKRAIQEFMMQSNSNGAQPPTRPSIGWVSIDLRKEERERMTQIGTDHGP